MKVKGKHSKVFLVGPVAVKLFKKNVAENVEKEWVTLKKIKRLRIAPVPYLKMGRMIIMSRVSGVPVCGLSDQEIKRLAPDFLKALHELDKMGIMKEENHRPNKHFFKTQKGIRLIDFERSHKGRGNVTQFLSYLQRFFPGINRLGKQYKKDIDLKPILRFIGSK